MDLEFVRPGRIDRRVYIGLPDAKQRVQIFGVHSAGKERAEDVDFQKVVLMYSCLCLIVICFVSVFSLWVYVPKLSNWTEPPVSTQHNAGMGNGVQL